MKKFAVKLKRAFTIVELFIVMAVIAILAAVLIPTFTNVISSARENAALQECHNAMIEYLAGHYTEDTPNGLTFVNKGYAYVNINGSLQSAGKIEKLSHLNANGEFVGKDKMPAGIKIPEGTLTNNEIWITVASESDTQVLQITLLDEDIYFYNVKDKENQKEYIGFFTLANESNPEKASYHIQNTDHSHESDVVAVSEGSSITVTTENPSKDVSGETERDMHRTLGEWELSESNSQHVRKCTICGKVMEQHSISCADGATSDGDSTHTGPCSENGCTISVTEAHTGAESCDKCSWSK